MNGDGQAVARADGLDRLEHQSRASDALKSGITVSVTTWSGRKLKGTVSDRDQVGTLLDPDEDGGAGGYTFVPWSSVEQVEIPAVAHRRVKFLQS